MRQILYDNYFDGWKAPDAPQPTTVPSDLAVPGRNCKIAAIAVVAFAAFAPAPLNNPPVFTPVGGYTDFPEIVATRTVPQQFTYFQPQSTTALTPVGGFTEFPSVIRRYDVPQQFSYFQPLGTISGNTVPVGGYADFPEIVATRKVAQQFITDVTSTSAAQTPVGGFTDFPTLFRKYDVPQQFASFQPQGTITQVVTTPTGWLNGSFKLVTQYTVISTQPMPMLGLVPNIVALENPWPIAFVKPFKVTQQQFSGLISGTQASNTTTSGYFNYQFDYKFLKPLKVSEQQFAYFQPLGTITNTTPVGGFTDFPTLFRKSDVPQQFITDLTARSSTQTVVGGFADFPEIVATRQVPQQFAYFQPLGTITQAATPSTFLQNSFRLAVRRFRFIGQFEAQIAEPLAPVEGWRNYQYDYSLIKPLKVTEQQFTGIVVPVSQASSGTPVGGFADFPEIVATRKVPQQFITDVTARSNAQTPVGGLVDFPTLFRKYDVPQQFAYFQPQGSIAQVVVNTSGWLNNSFKLAVKYTVIEAQPLPMLALAPLDQLGYQDFQWDYALVKPLKVTKHQFITDVTATSGTQAPVGGYADFPEIIKTWKVPQQFAYFQPQGAISSSTAVGGHVDFPTLFRKSDVPQQFNAFQPEGTIITGSVASGWNNNSFRLAVRRPVLLGRFKTQVTAIPLVFEGWRNYQFDYSFAAKYPVALQQYPSLLVFPQPPNLTVYKEGWRGYQFDYRFTKPYPVTEQKFEYFTPAGTIVTVEETHTRFFIHNVGLLMGIR